MKLLTHGAQAQSANGGKALGHGLALAAVMIGLTAGAAAQAAPTKPKAPTAAQVQALAQCVSVADDAARLACYDKAAKALVEAEKTGDVVVVDQAQVKEVKRQSFGFNINLGPMFDRGPHAEQVNELATAVDSAWQTGEGKWIVRTAEGQIWRQIDSETLYADPKKGEKVVIRHGSLGSYFLKIGNDVAIRAHRDE